MKPSPRTFIAVLPPHAALALARSGRIPPISGDALVAGDRVAILAAYGPSFIRDSAFVGVGRVRARAGALELRRTVAAPPGHAVPLFELGIRLRSVRGWTDRRLTALVGSLVPAPAADVAFVETKILAQALVYGPPPSRPAHARPRTPGRRALIVGRVAARGGHW